MPPKRSPESKDAKECILQIGKYNNIVAWNLDIRESINAVYGDSASFLYTDDRYVAPLPREADYLLAYPAGAPDALPMSAALIADLKKDAFTGRAKQVRQQKLDEKKIWSIMWMRMSTASQSKVKEEEGFEAAQVAKDCVLLWEFIRRTHLTHVYGDLDPMVRLNKREQMARYSALRQGDREYIASFKTRYDAQILASRGAGVADIDEETMAMDFIHKLDTKRYEKMLVHMRRNALCNGPDAYPTTLASALRIASGWVDEGSSSVKSGGTGTETHSAFVTADLNLVTKSKDTSKKHSTNSAADVPSGKKKSLSEIECFTCGEYGHYARDCKDRKSSDKALVAGGGKADSSDEDYDDAYNGEVAYVTTCELVLFSRDDVLLDSQASVNVFCNPMLLKNVRKSDRQVVLNGVQSNANGVNITMEGDFGDVGTVYYSNESTANILSCAVMVDQGNDVRYDQKFDRFELRPAGSKQVYSFCRKKVAGSEGRFYCCDVNTMVGQFATTYPIQNTSDHALVETELDNMRKYTKREVEGAHKARHMLAKMGFPPVSQAIDIVTRGVNFDVTGTDFRIADDIWGPDIASMKGKMKKQASRIADINIGTQLIQQEQILSVDIMYVEGIPSLIGLATPLDLTMAVSLLALDSNRGSRSVSIIRDGILSFISMLASRNFVTSLIMSDGEGAIGAIKGELNLLGVEVDVSGAGGHVARIERKIQTVKERVRAHISHQLPFTLNTLGVAMLVLFCVSRLNYQTSGTGHREECPRVAFSGRPVNQSIDFRAAFGEYAQCTVPNTDSSMSARTEDCIVMLPVSNRTGSVQMMSLRSGKLVLRDQFKIMPMPSTVITRLNEMATAEGRKLVNCTRMVYPKESGLIKPGAPTYIRSTAAPFNDDITEINGAIEGFTVGSLADEVGVEHTDSYSAIDIENDIREMDSESLSLDPTPVNMEFNAADLDVGPLVHFRHPIEDVYVQPDASIPVTPPRSGSRGAGDIDRTGYEVAVRSPPLRRDILNYYNANEAAVIAKDHAMNISVKEALRSRGVVAERVIMKELSQMRDKKVWTPVHMSALSSTEKHRIIRSQMFLKEKYLPTGVFEKLKARLVAGGNQQDKELYDDLSSPTVSTCAVMTVFSIAAHERRSASVVDIGGAYLNADMSTGIDVYMRLDPTMSKMMITLDASYEGYADKKGCIVVKLDKALYGCVESAALWYENLSATLNDLGYERNDYELCVFNKVCDGTQCTAAVHVDDLIITSVDQGMIDGLCDGLKGKYGEITRHDGPILNYLGMVFDLTVSGEVRMSMKGYTDDTISYAGILGRARSPATNGLFDIRSGVDLVPENARVWFHSVVAKLSYLAKRAKPECLTAVAYLATRVTRCTTDDVEKLKRLLKYVADTRERGVVFRPGSKGICVRVFIDAAYGVHADGKSHTGSCVVIGDVGAVHCKSSKQSIVTKSSTEAELVALSDSANQGLYIRNFLISQGYAMGPMIIYQDNMSCMALVERGRSGAERTRHIEIRHFWIRERIRSEEAIVMHKGTAEMYANVLTKPVQGAQFVYERGCLTGWD